MLLKIFSDFKLVFLEKSSFTFVVIYCIIVLCVLFYFLICFYFSFLLSYKISLKLHMYKVNILQRHDLINFK